MENQSISITGLGLFLVLLVVSMQMLEMLSLCGEPGPGGAGSSACMFIMAEVSCPSHPGGKDQKIIQRKRKYVGSEHGTHPKENCVGMRGERADSAEITCAFSRWGMKYLHLRFGTEAARKLRFQFSCGSTGKGWSSSSLDRSVEELRSRFLVLPGVFSSCCCVWEPQSATTLRFR